MIEILHTGDIDAYTGGLAEMPVEGGLVGFLIHYSPFSEHLYEWEYTIMLLHVKDLTFCISATFASCTLKVGHTGLVRKFWRNLM